jgi:hypothetical protein
MKQLITSILFISLLSCNSTNTDREKKPNDDSLNRVSTTIDFKQLDTTLSFAGYWVDEKYVNEILQKKSPTMTQVPSISCFPIPNRTKQITRLVSGFHEGGEDLVVLKNGTNYELWDSELKNKRKQITIISNDRIKLDNDFFVRLRNYNVSDKSGEPKILEEILFAGKYKTDKGQIVEFNPNGQLLGFDNYNNFEAYVDYADQGMQVDKFVVRQNASSEKEFGFKFKSDSLFIYNLKCLEYDQESKTCVDFGFDNLKLVLVKVD